MLYKAAMYSIPLSPGKHTCVDPLYTAILVLLVLICILSIIRFASFICCFSFVRYFSQFHAFCLSGSLCRPKSVLHLSKGCSPALSAAVSCPS
jgi:hypothetical protein